VSAKKEKLLEQLGGNMAASIAGCPGQPPPAAAADAADGRRFAGRSRDAGTCRIAVGRVAPDPTQPRKTFDPGGLTDLAASLRTFGQLQPCVVRWDAAAGVYVLLAGERRWRAAKLAGLPDLRCVVWDEAGGATDPATVAEVQLVENAVRADVPPLEQAAAYRDLMDRRGWTAGQLAARLSVNPGTVAKALALLRLDPETRGLVAAGAVSASAGYELAKVADAGERQRIAAAAAAGGLGRDAVAGLAAAARGNRPAAGKGGRVPAARYTSPGGWAVTVAAPAGSPAAAVAAELRALAAAIAGKPGRRAA
jgi:ParB family chromosome partitioning protein